MYLVNFYNNVKNVAMLHERMGRTAEEWCMFAAQ
jgi:hypothetical protein